jgi:hypothetical protein
VGPRTPFRGDDVPGSADGARCARERHRSGPPRYQHAAAAHPSSGAGGAGGRHAGRPLGWSLAPRRGERLLGDGPEDLRGLPSSPRRPTRGRNPIDSRALARRCSLYRRRRVLPRWLQALSSADSEANTPHRDRRAGRGRGRTGREAGRRVSDQHHRDPRSGARAGRLVRAGSPGAGQAPARSDPEPGPLRGRGRLGADKRDRVLLDCIAGPLRFLGPRQHHPAGGRRAQPGDNRPIPPHHRRRVGVHRAHRGVCRHRRGRDRLSHELRGGRISRWWSVRFVSWASR